jgi:hypothetical protein
MSDDSINIYVGCEKPGPPSFGVCVLAKNHSGGCQCMKICGKTIARPNQITLCRLAPNHAGGCDAVDGEAAKRIPVDFDYASVHPQFLKGLARIAGYAAEKYGTWHQYLGTRLVGDKSPVNHAYDHIRAYREQEVYERLDGHPRWHLVAAAYNLMMAFVYDERFGPEENHFKQEKP